MPIKKANWLKSLPIRLVHQCSKASKTHIRANHNYLKSLIKKWLPRSSTQRTKSVTELIPCYYIYNHKKQGLSKDQKPATFPANKAITQKDWKRSIRQKRKLTNPVRTGFEFVEYLNKNPNATYDDLSVDAGITKARVCQMIALCKRLPPEITDYLINTDEPEILKHFKERKLRPLTLLASNEDKIKKFDEMKEALAKGRISANFS